LPSPLVDCKCDGERAESGTLHQQLPLPSPAAELRDDQEKNGGARGRTGDGGNNDRETLPGMARAKPRAGMGTKTTQPPALTSAILAAPGQAVSPSQQHALPGLPGQV
jgi:hypothetical protein